jgi:hypothetical protein
LLTVINDQVFIHEIPPPPVKFGVLSPLYLHHPNLAEFPLKYFGTFPLLSIAALALTPIFLLLNTAAYEMVYLKMNSKLGGSQSTASASHPGKVVLQI